MKIFSFQYGGVNVDVQMTEGDVYVTFSPYRPGMAPALILNHTNDALSFSEKGSNTIMYDHISFISLVPYMGPWTLKLSV
jgi:vacuolar protein sorting-associated protein 13A/C